MASPGAAEDRFLPIQGQMISVLAQQHLSQQAGGGVAFVDDVRLDRRLLNALALGACPLAADVALDA
jgi:hypothetical protein